MSWQLSSHDMCKLETWLNHKNHDYGKEKLHTKFNYELIKIRRNGSRVSILYTTRSEWKDHSNYVRDLPRIVHKAAVVATAHKGNHIAATGFAWVTGRIRVQAPSSPPAESQRKCENPASWMATRMSVPHAHEGEERHRVSGMKWLLIHVHAVTRHGKFVNWSISWSLPRSSCGLLRGPIKDWQNSSNKMYLSICHKHSLPKNCFSILCIPSKYHDILHRTMVKIFCFEKKYLLIFLITLFFSWVRVAPDSTEFP